MASRRKFVRAMLKAINRAKTGVITNDSSRTDGLRAIRDFERVNGIAFNPFDETHLDGVAGMGPHAGFIRKMKSIFRRHDNAV